MTFEELKKHAEENGTQAGVLVSSLAAAMVERGDSDERLLNLVETAEEQDSQGGALLIELLDVMYDLGYDEDTIDELWEGCSQQGNQSGPLVAPTAEIAAVPPLEKPYPSERGAVDVYWGGTGFDVRVPGVTIYNGGDLFKPDTEITAEWVRDISEYLTFKSSVPSFTSVETDVFVAKSGQLTASQTLYVKYGSYANGAEVAIIQDGPTPTRIAVLIKAKGGDAFTVWVPDRPYAITSSQSLYYRNNRDYAALVVFE